MTNERVGRACDACKLRKVKCSGGEECNQCAHLNLHCVYSAKLSSIANKANNRTNIKRGRIISLYKQGVSSALLDHKTTAITSEALFVAHYAPNKVDQQFNEKFFLNLIPDYMTIIFPGFPVISELELKKAIGHMADNSVCCALVYAVGAATITLSTASIESLPGVKKQAEFLCTRSLDIRGPFRPHEQISVTYIMTSCFLHICCAGQQDHDGAWFYLRESITLTQLLRINESEEVDPPTRKDDKMVRQRLYWMLFVHERFRAVYDYRQAIMSPFSGGLPEYNDSISLSNFHYFKKNIQLLKLIDEVFMENWISKSSSKNLTQDWITKVRSTLAQEPTELSEFEEQVLPEMQRFDLVITRHWLRMLLWKIATAGGYLSSDPLSGCLFVRFPVILSQRLRTLVESTDRKSIEMNGNCVVRKLYELISPISDVISTIPSDSREQLIVDIDNCIYLSRFLCNNARMSESRRIILDQKLEYLKAKFEDYYENYPSNQE